MGVEEEVPSGLKEQRRRRRPMVTPDWLLNGRPNSRQPRAANLNVIALQYLDGSGHDLERNEFENSADVPASRGQSCIRQNRIYAATPNASLLFYGRSRARRLPVVLFDHVKFDPDLMRPESLLNFL